MHDHDPYPKIFAPPPTLKIAYSTWSEYTLIDSGNYRKLERFGSRTIIRSEPKAWWRPELPAQAWEKAQAICDAEGQWTFPKPIDPAWCLHFDDLTLEARFTQMSKHVGIFPEQSPHWEWIKEQGMQVQGRNPRLLSLFGYTGAATLVAAAHGFSVTHVDASKPALAWAKHNQTLSGLGERPIRWILDDAAKFIQREMRRGRRYDALLLDPPSFGRGPKQEVWKIEKHLPALLETCRQILSDDPLFVILTMYAIEASALMLGNLLSDMLGRFDGQLSLGELALKTQQGKNILPMSIFGRWAKTA